MDSVFKKVIVLITFCLCSLVSDAQLLINFSVKPPFTPFISDYTNPARLQDIDISVFNPSANKLRVKFKLTLRNQAKGIEISLKETTTPINPFTLEPNEFKFVVLEDVSNLYGKLSQNSFNIVGADIQNLILDGTIPDGMYEVCLQAYDFDAPGFSFPLSAASPSGCFSFQVNYTDPPTDIRLNNNFLQYSFGGEVPKIGVNGAMGQNYSIQFTAPAFNTGCDYEYELFVYDKNTMDPTRQSEASLMEAITTVSPLINKTSNIPFFTIDPGDLELDFNSNYFLIIKVTDLNQKALFKNKGYSTFKAFKLVDIQPFELPAPSFDFTNCGKTITTAGKNELLIWNNNLELEVEQNIKNRVKTRIKAIRLNTAVLEPSDIFESNAGEVIIDTIISHSRLSRLQTLFGLDSRFGKNEANNLKKWVIAIQHIPNQDDPLAANISFQNNGKSSQCVVKFNLSQQMISSGKLAFNVDYPLNNDTIPFQFPPIVVKTSNIPSTGKIIFTQLNDILEPVESNKYFKLSYDADVNTQLNGSGLDSALSSVAKILNRAADLAFKGKEEQSEAEIERARVLLNSIENRASVQIMHSLGMKNTPLGNGAKGKQALISNILKYQVVQQLYGDKPNLDIPNISNLLYLLPYKHNILWTGKIGVYDTRYASSFSVKDYENKFRNNSFSASDLRSSLLKDGFKSYSGNFSVGMGRPEIDALNGQKFSSKTVTFSFLPSKEPKKLLPEFDKNEAWKDFDSLSVAQQWNIEISKKKDFSKIDTTIFKRIAKLYDITKGANDIKKDLYNKVNIKVTLKDTGKFFWRVTWSNPTIPDNAPESEKRYYRQLLTLLGGSELLGQEVDFTNYFFKSTPYVISKIDSFRVSPPKSANTIVSNIPPPRFEVIYPMEGDTIPFYYPPTVIKMNPIDTAYKFVLTKFDSPLEPFINLNYYIFDTLNEQSKRLRTACGKDSLMANGRRIIDAISLGADSKGALPGDQLQNVKDILINEGNQINKRFNLVFYKSQNSEIFPLGNSLSGKYRMMDSILRNDVIVESMPRDGNTWQFSINGSDKPEEKKNSIQDGNLRDLIYLKPYKEVNWNADLCFYTPYFHGPRLITGDTMEYYFVNNYMKLRDFPTSLTNGMAHFSGKFHVGMKQPVITLPLNGKKVQKNKIEITFKPSRNPQSLFPISDNSEAWKQFKQLYIAQQWNIEVSDKPTFDTIRFVKSKCIIDKYFLPGSIGNVMNDLYNPRTETISLPKTGKYYYRITWSNPTKLDTGKNANPEQQKFFDEMERIVVKSQKYSVDSAVSTEDFETFKEKLRINYKISAIDSFTATDTLIVTTRDTAKCGLNCRYEDPISQIPSVEIRVNDMVDVGKFKMKVTKISFSGQNATGEGLIDCDLFPAPIAVDFSNIKFNENKRLMLGTIKAKYKRSDLIGSFSETSNTGFSLFDNFKNKILSSSTGTPLGKEIYDYINDPVCTVVDFVTQTEITMPYGLSNEVNNFPATIAFTDISFNPNLATFNAVSLLDFDLNFAVDLHNRLLEEGDTNTIDTGEFYRHYVGFGVSGLCLNPKGMSDVGMGGALDLIGEVKIPLSDSITFRLIGKSDPNSTTTATRMVWDCKGFKHLAIKASITIGRPLLKPMEDDGKTESPELLVATGTAEISSWNDFLLSLDFSKKFQIPGVPGYNFTVRNVTLDLSTRSNPEGIVFPAQFNGEKTVAWRGLYFKEVSFDLPDYIIEGNTIDKAKLVARDFMVDANGITGKVNLENILTLENGSFEGWKFSIDTLSLSVINSVPVRVGLTGDIGCPLIPAALGYDLSMSYNAKKDSLGFGVQITNAENLEIPAWFAKLTLDEGSFIEFVGDPRHVETFAIQSNFSGTIDLGAQDIAGLKDVRFGSLPFEGLKVRTRLSSVDSFSITLDKLGGLDVNRLIADSPDPSGGDTPPEVEVTGEQETAGFPINIKDIKFDAFNGNCTFEISDLPPGFRVGIKFTVFVNVVDSKGETGIGGSCNLGIYGTALRLNELWSFSAVGLNIDTIKINAKLSGVVSIEGGIIFLKNDSKFGNGIVGGVKATFVQDIGVSLTGMFGEKDGTRYWMIGADLSLPPIPIDFSANVIYANYFSGEAWYHMKRTPSEIRPGGFVLGKSPSGATFQPDSKELFGFGAQIGLQGPPGGSPIYGRVGAFASIGTDGGLTSISLQGDLWFINSTIEAAPLIVNGTLYIDFTQRKFAGNMTALVNVGEGAVRGRNETLIGSNKYYVAGSVNLLVQFNKQIQWHIKMGDPFVRQGKLGFGFYAGNQELFQAGGYFMLGNDIPNRLPDLDEGLRTKLTQSGLASFPNQRAEQAPDDFAILMGIDAKVPEKRVELGPFFAGISLDFSMDGILKPGFTNCGKDKNGNQRNGLSGWYANGRALAAINGALGVKLDLSFIPQKELIAGTIGAGAIINAGFGNPYYFNGEFSAYFQVLGGLIEGTKTFAFEYLEDTACRQIGSSNLKSKFGIIVADINPKNEAKEVLVGIQPMISLNFAIGVKNEIKYIEEVERDGRMVPENKIAYLTSKIESITMKQVAGNVNITPARRMLNNNLDIELRPVDYLLPDQDYEIVAKFYMELTMPGKKKDIISRVKDTTVIFRFRTEKVPQFQPQYILYTTPFQGEQYFKKGDAGNYGKIVSQAGSAVHVKDVFFNPPNNQLTHYDVFYAQYVNVADEKDTFSVPLEFNSNKQNIYFKLTDKLVKYKIYHLRIIRERRFINQNLRTEEFDLSSATTKSQTQGDKSIDAKDIVADELKKSGGNLGTQNGNSNPGSSAQQERNAQELFRENMRIRQASNNDETKFVLVEFPFKLSEYNTLQDKINQLTFLDQRVPIPNDSLFLRFQTNEPFERYEVGRVYFNDTSGSFSPRLKVTNQAETAELNNNAYLLGSFYFMDVFSNNNRLTTLTTPWLNDHPEYLDLNGTLRSIVPDVKTIDYSVFIFDRHIIEPLCLASKFWYGSVRSMRIANAGLPSFVNQYNGNLNAQLTSTRFGLNEEAEFLRRSGIVIPTGSNTPTSTAPPPANSGTLLNVNTYMFKTIANQHYDLWQKAYIASSNNLSSSSMPKTTITRLTGVTFQYPACNDYFPIKLVNSVNSTNTIYKYRKPCSNETYTGYKALYEPDFRFENIEFEAVTTSVNCATCNSVPLSVPQDRPHTNVPNGR